MLGVSPSDSATKGSKTASPVLVELPDPVAGDGEVLVRIKASALNRADLLQMRGLYPPPPGESPIPGLECAGEVEALGSGVADWQVGDPVMALLAGGGHAEKVAVPTGQLMPIPEGLSFEEAAALPEVGLTAWTNLVVEGNLRADQTVLIVAAASGVGTFAAQLARELGARVLVAGRSLDRLERLRELGASECIALSDDLVEKVRQITDCKGVDLIMDLAGGESLGERLPALAHRGTCVLVGVMAGWRTELDLGDVLRRRLRIQGSVLRSRSRAEKAELVGDFLEFSRHRFLSGALRPVIHEVLPFGRVADAYQQMQSGGMFGKLVLRMS